MAQSKPDRHSSSTPQIPFRASNPAFSPVLSPSFDNDPCSSSTDRPITANSMRSTSSDSSSSSSGTGSTSSYTSSNPTSQDSCSDLPDKHSSTTSLTYNQADAFNSHSHNNSESFQRPVSPFRAPRPPLHQQSSRSLLSRPTAMQSYVRPLHDSTSYPPPDPPVILPENGIMDQSSFRSQAPYFPFLSHAPSPENSWIEVETLQHEYKLHVRLPGFSSDSITLATKRRRILHVVADKWENGGGHFERRISFGYDADLAHVRADFDGLMLCIMVPRRISPFTTARSPPAAVGRM